jgi:hypothetical protein
MVGAGLSSALGLPITASLVSDVLESYEQGDRWRHSGSLGESLKRAFQLFYPDGGNKDFRPNAVDFFSTLKIYMTAQRGSRAACGMLRNCYADSSSRSLASLFNDSRRAKRACAPRVTNTSTRSYSAATSL